MKNAITCLDVQKTFSRLTHKEHCSTKSPRIALSLAPFCRITLYQIPFSSGFMLTQFLKGNCFVLRHATQGLFRTFKGVAENARDWYSYQFRPMQVHYRYIVPCFESTYFLIHSLALIIPQYFTPSLKDPAEVKSRCTKFLSELHYLHLHIVIWCSQDSQRITGLNYKFWPIFPQFILQWSKTAEWHESTPLWHTSFLTFVPWNLRSFVDRHFDSTSEFHNCLLNSGEVCSFRQFCLMSRSSRFDGLSIPIFNIILILAVINNFPKRKNLQWKGLSCKHLLITRAKRWDTKKKDC